MFYQKNLYAWEQWLRIAFSVAVGVVGYSLNLDPLWKWTIVASAVFGVVTGFIGFCPACAMVGKKLKDKTK